MPTLICNFPADKICSKHCAKSILNRLSGRIVQDFYPHVLHTFRILDPQIIELLSSEIFELFCSQIESDRVLGGFLNSQIFRSIECTWVFRILGMDLWYLPP